MPPDPDISAIAVHLDELLEARNMTLTELASRVGLTLANLSILKTGKARAIRFTTLAAICAELRCQPGDLFTFNGGPPAPDPRGPVAAAPETTRQRRRTGL